MEQLASKQIKSYSELLDHTLNKVENCRQIAQYKDSLTMRGIAVAGQHLNASSQGHLAYVNNASNNIDVYEQSDSGSLKFKCSVYIGDKGMVSSLQQGNNLLIVGCRDGTLLEVETTKFEVKRQILTEASIMSLTELSPQLIVVSQTVSSGYLDNRGKLELIAKTDREVAGFTLMCSAVVSTGDINKILKSSLKPDQLILGC